MTNLPIAASAAAFFVRITHNGQPVLTTGMLAVAYGTPEIRLHQGFQRNTKQFVPDEAYFKLEGEELREFKKLYSGKSAFAQPKGSGISRPLESTDRLKDGQMGGTDYLKDSLPDLLIVQPNVKSLILWTEVGCLLHAKIIDNDIAWSVYRSLIQAYFRLREIEQEIPIERFAFSEREVQAIYRELRQIVISYAKTIDPVAKEILFSLAQEQAQKIGIPLPEWVRRLHAARIAQSAKDDQSMLEGF